MREEREWTALVPNREATASAACWRDEQIDRVLPIQSDAQLYKQAGNGVTVTVVEAIGKRLASAHREVNAID